MFIHFYSYDVLIYFLNSLIIKVHINVFVYMNDNMYYEFFSAYKYYILILKIKYSKNLEI